MLELKNVFEKIVENRKLNKDDIEKNKLEDEKDCRFYTLEGVNLENGEEEKYLIYDCSGKDTNFDYDKYKEKISEVVDSIPIFLFKNWDDEMNQYFGCYDKLDSGKKKKELSNYFDTKLSFYTDIENSLKLYVKEPVNFNEYVLDSNKTNSLEGYIYNFSLKELKKLFNITGKELFKKNVRKGLKKNPIIEEIKVSFRNYLYTYLYSKLKEDLKESNNYVDIIEEIKNDLVIHDSVIECNSPEYFWFCHNGITIFSYDDAKIDRSGNYISLNPDKVSVINGAQTLTNFYLELENVKREVSKKLFKYGINKKRVITLLDEAHEMTIVKTIFIHGKEEFVKPITYGLNKQVPVLGEHILADSEIVRKLNSILKKRKIEILKEGDFPLYGQGLDVLEFTKKYLIIKSKPGRSKNLKKQDMKDILKEALAAIEKNENENYYLQTLNFLIEIDDWWKKSKKNRDDLYTKDNYRIINSFGKNYFGSYLIKKAEKNKDILDGDEQYLEIQYNEFLKEFGDSDSNLSASDFKKDELFSSFIDNFNQSINENVQININCDELKQHLNDNTTSQYSVSNDILKYLNKNNIELEYFRVIKRLGGKCKEAYPFPSSCFIEINNEFLDEENPDEENDINNSKLNFEKSKFKKEVLKEFPVFVIEKVLDKDKEVIDKIEYIPNFSFKEFAVEAKDVFEKTMESFYKGDILLFPKSSDDLCFHVRPKAKNGNDTFEFTNGEQITKRTFWANKSTVKELIDKFLDPMNKDKKYQ